MEGTQEASTRDIVAARPRLALRVGVAGHRTFAAGVHLEISRVLADTLEQIETHVRSIAADPSAGYAAQDPVLRAVSCLAEGSDRLMVREALKRKWEVQAVLPLERAEYAKTFRDDSSVRDFEGLLDHLETKAVLELDGDPSDRENAYRRAGRILLDQCDLLIAVLDEERPQGSGVTGEVVRIATQSEIPIVLIDPRRPGAARLRVCQEGRRGCEISPEDFRAGLREAIDALVRLETTAPRRSALGRPWMAKWIGHEADVDPFGTYAFRPPADWPLLSPAWKAFLRCLRVASSGSAPAPLPDGPFRPAFERADRTALRYAALYRGSFLLNSLFGVLAVLCALLANARVAGGTAWTWLELFFIGSILGLIYRVRRFRWHERSLDVRYLAELLRQMLFLHPLGRAMPAIRPPLHPAFGDARSSWMNWRFRAAVRSVRMPGGRLRDRVQEAPRDLRRAWVKDQIAYHLRNAASMLRLGKVIHCATRTLFAATALACLVHLFDHEHRLGAWLTLFSAGLPALGAALHAIASQGEFHRLAELSASMFVQLREHRDRLPRGACTGLALGDVAVDLAATMMNDVSGWRVVYKKPPLELG